MTEWGASLDGHDQTRQHLAGNEWTDDFHRHAAAVDYLRHGPDCAWFRRLRRQMAAGKPLRPNQVDNVLRIMAADGIAESDEWRRQ